MAEPRRMVCILCPRGCALEVELAVPSATSPGSEAPLVRGNACKRGEAYGRAEVLDPRRSLTSTVRTRGQARRRLPVRTSAPIPLGLLVKAVASLDSLEVEGPVRCGDVIVADFLGLGVDLVATDSLGPSRERRG